MTEFFKTMGRKRLALAGAGLLALGGAAGAVAVQTTRPSVTMAPVTPVAIRSLGSEGIVTIKGRVAEVYGNKFILRDASGRALVDTGREGEAGLVRAGQPVTVQGRFDDGFVHAAFLVGADGKVTALGPLAGPGGHRRHRGPHGPGGHGGFEGGPDDGPGGPHGDMPPPVAPPAQGATAPAAAPPPTDG